MIILDAPAAEGILGRMLAEDQSLHAPHLLDLEVLQVLRRYALTRQIDPERAESAVRDFLDIPLNRYPHEPFLHRAWELRHNLTAYDAVDIALAEALGATIRTRDGRLAASKRHTATLSLV